MTSSLHKREGAQSLAQAIVDTLHEPFLVLDAELRVLAASRSFFETFQVDDEGTQGLRLYDLGAGQWDIPALRLLLETIIPERAAMDDFEVEHDFPSLGHRVMLLNARKVRYSASDVTNILLAFTDITARRAIEREKAELLARTESLLRDKQVLLQEMEHRIANSLQIIASILMLKVRAVSSDEARGHLRDAHQRVMSMAAVQAHLHAVGAVEQVEVGPYLTRLCASLAAAMINDGRPIRLEVAAALGTISSAQAVNLGLVVTELVINAIKYAFPDDRADAQVRVTFEGADIGWSLCVADNGVGKRADAPPPKAGGLGTVIITALLKQLDARMRIDSNAGGLAVTIEHAGGVEA